MGHRSGCAKIARDGSDMTRQSRGGRVVLITSAFPRLSETFIVSKFVGLLSAGRDVHIVCASRSAADWNAFPDLRADDRARGRRHCAWPHRPRWLAFLLTPLAALVCILRSPAASLRYLRRGAKRFGLDVWRRLYLDAEIVALDPDVIHFEFGALAVGRTYLKHLLGCQMVVSFRGYDLNHSGLEDPGYYRDVWETVDGVHVLGEGLWRQAQRRGCPAEMRHMLIPPALDAAKFEPKGRVHADVAGSADRPLRVLCVGRLEWKKGYEYALQAIQILRDRGVHVSCRIVGAGHYVEALAFALNQMGLQQQVEMLGALPREKVREELMHADVFLHAAVSEGFCNAVIEAQSMMLPVVCSDADGLRDNVVHGVTGFVVPRRDALALADRLEALAADPALRQQMGVSGRQRVIERFRIEDQIAAFGSLYDQVLEAACRK